MHHVVNHDQAAAWNGPEGEHWAEHGTHAPTEIDHDLLAAADVGATDVVLDIGCGTGQTTLSAARLAPDGFALGVDLSAPQLAQARRAAAEQRVPNVAFEQGDAQVHPLAPGAFDLAVSRFGIMFFADPVAAFANIAGALRSDGRLTFVTPQAAADQPWFTEPIAGLLADTPDVPSADDGSPGMFSFADPDRIVAVLVGRRVRRRPRRPAGHADGLRADHRVGGAVLPGQRAGAGTARRTPRPGRRSPHPARAHAGAPPHGRRCADARHALAGHGAPSVSRGDPATNQAGSGSGVRSTRRRSWALAATTIVERLMRTRRSPGRG